MYRGSLVTGNNASNVNVWKNWGTDVNTYPYGSTTGGVGDITIGYPIAPLPPNATGGTITFPPQPLPPSKEMIKAAEKLLHDPNFDVGKFLAKLLARHLQDNLLEYMEDPVIGKYLPV